MIRARAVAVLVLAAFASPAGAHALLEDTSPSRGEAVEAPPRQVVLRFSEPVEIAFGAVRVFDAGGAEVQRGAPFHPGGRAKEVAVRLGDVEDSAYTTTYRVVSADSHPVAGGFVFSVGDAAAAPASSVAELLGDQRAGPVTSVAFSAARAVEYGAIALAIGVIAIATFVWPAATRAARGGALAVRAAPGGAAAAAFSRRTRALLLATAGAGVLAALAALCLQAATAAGRSFWAAIGGAPEVLETRFGVVWGLSVVAWALVAALRATPAVAVPVLALALLPGRGGHAGVQDPVALLLPANVLHVLAAGAWIGGLAVLVLALPAAARELDPPGRTRLLAATLGRFSALAPVAVAALLAGGIAQSLLELGAVDDLSDTAFGRAILVKAGLVVALLALGALNRRRVLPRLRRIEGAPGATGVLLRRTLRAEVVLGVAAFAATGALAGYPPPTAQAPGPFAASADLGPARADLTVEPARPGANEIHVYLFDRSDGRQYDAPKEVRFEAALPEKRIALKLPARKAGPGHYVAGAVPLAPAGDWRLELVARVSDFDELRTTYTVPVK